MRDAECVKIRSPAGEAFERLSSLRFDQAPVTNRARVVGWVATDTLEEAPNVRGVMKPLERSAIVSKEASIADVLQLLDDGFVFIVDEHGISGFVTPSDLERHAARSHFYLLVAGVEMLLSAIVRAQIDPLVIVDRFSEESRERWDADRTTSQETHPAEYLYVRDLADLFLGLPDARSEHGWDRDMTNVLTEICQFLPRVMHANRPLVMGRAAAQLASLARRAEELIARLEEIAARRSRHT